MEPAEDHTGSTALDVAVSRLDGGEQEEQSFEEVGGAHSGGDSPPAAEGPSQGNDALSPVAAYEGADGGDTREGSTGNSYTLPTAVVALDMNGDDDDGRAPIETTTESSAGNQNAGAVAEATAPTVADDEHEEPAPTMGITTATAVPQDGGDGGEDSPQEGGYAGGGCNADEDASLVPVETQVVVALELLSSNPESPLIHHSDDETNIPVETCIHTAGTQQQQQSFLAEEVAVEAAREEKEEAAATAPHDEDKTSQNNDLAADSNLNATSAAVEECISAVNIIKTRMDGVDLRLDRINVALHDHDDAASQSLEMLRREQQDIRETLQITISNVDTSLRGVFVEQSEQAYDETKRQVSDAYDSLAGALRDVETQLRVDIQDSSARAVSDVTFLLDQLAERVSRLEVDTAAERERAATEMKTVHHSLATMEQRLDTALRMEILPPSAPLPTDGVRIRLVVDVDCPESIAPSKSMLIPISQKATIGMLKRETLRRAIQQSIIPAHMHTVFVFSKTVVIHQDLVLFEEDTLEDYGIQPNDKLVICSVAREDTTSTAPIAEHVIVFAQHPPPPTVSVSHAEATSFTSHAISHADEMPNRNAALSASEAAKAHVDAYAALFLDEEAVKRLDEQESMDRRLIAELARMDLEPLRREEQTRRVGILKAAADKIRITLMDRATYSHDDYERRVARGALEKLNDALSLSATPLSITEATLAAKNVLSSLSSNRGEDDRISALQSAAAAERGRKERLLEDIKDLIFTVRQRIRIPPELYTSAESLIFSAERVLLLAPSTTIKEIDAVHREFTEFVDKLRTSKAAAAASAPSRY